MVEYQLPKLATGVRFPSLAPVLILILLLAGCKTVEHVPYTTDVKTISSVRQYVKPGFFVWPLKGSIISYFGSKTDRTRNKGIDIGSREGANVKAARAGKVVFCDEWLKGFGKTVILDHGDNLQTVYAYNSIILVKLGDIVNQNDAVARVGRGGRAKEPSLHFEIRKNGEPQNPFYYLSR